MTRKGELPVLTMKEVGAILGEYRTIPKPSEKNPNPVQNTTPLTSKSVSQYLAESKAPGRYADHPFPAPAGHIGQWPYWLPTQEKAIRAWAAKRRGAGARTDLGVPRRRRKTL